MSEPHELWCAAADLRIPAQASLLLIAQRPVRWDELLDTRLPVLISGRLYDDPSGQGWTQLCHDLWEAGCPATLPASLVQQSGEVLRLDWNGPALEPAPSGSGWALYLGPLESDAGWRALLPLWGRRYVVTRSAQQGASLVERLSCLGARAYAVPTITFADPDDFSPWVRAVEAMTTFTWILFTSPNGVDFFVERLCRSGLDLRTLAAARLGCIGPSTARALARHSLKADLVAEEYVAEGLLKALVDRLGDSLGQQRILLPRAQVARSVLPDALTAAGAQVLVAPVYKTIPPPLEDLPEDAGLEPPRVLFTSSSTVDNWVAAVREHPAFRWPCFCIGPVTAGTAHGHGLHVLGVASTYTVDGLLDKVLQSDGQVAL